MPSPRIELASLAVCASLILEGCAGTLRLSKGFAQTPSSSGQPVPVTVRLVVDKSVRATHFKAGMSSFPFGIGNSVIYTDPGFSDALKTDLSRIFSEVRLEGSLDDGKEADYTAVVGDDFPKTLTVTFSDARSNSVVAAYHSPCLDADKMYYRDSLAWDFFGQFLGVVLFPIIVPIFMSADTSGEYRKTAEGAVASAIRSIDTQILADDEVTQTPAAKAKLTRLEASGDRAAEGGDVEVALGAYSSFLGRVRYEGRNDKRVREKGLKLLGSTRTKLPVPEEARRRMARGQYLAKEAHERTDYTSAEAEMQQAVHAAPWWPAAYYNLGLTQVAAGDFADASRSLNLYLLAAPDAQDADAVRRKIYELEVKAEHDGKS